jgi:hypothetical protein
VQNDVPKLLDGFNYKSKNENNKKEKARAHSLTRNTSGEWGVLKLRDQD